jgi:hypothetical protein
VPVLAIGGAIFAGFEAAGAVAAIGTAAFGIADALAITAAVGATLGAVGVVTHDKSLQTAGLILGGIGGIGSLAANAGLLGDTGAGSLFGFPDSVDITPINPGLAGSAGAAATATPDIVDSFGVENVANVLPTTALGQQTEAAAGTASDNLTAGLINSTPTPAPALTAQPTPVTGAPAPVPGIPASPEGQAPGAAAAATPNPPAPPGASDANPPGLFGRLTDFLTNNKNGGMIGYGLIQAGGSLVSGLFNPVTPAQVGALNAQAAANRAATSLSTTQQANMAQPLPTASRPVASNVTGVPAGLINTPKPGAVTGVPA